MGSFLKKVSYGLALPFAMLSLMAAQAPTTTTLAINPSSYVAFNTVVTLTATVRDVGPVAQGVVDFCNADMVNCTAGDGLYGSAEITTAGTGNASISQIFGYGNHNIKAVFHNIPGVDAGSTSSTGTLTVQASQIYSSSITLSETGSSSDYTLNGSLTAFGSQVLSGTLTFLDTSNGNAPVGTASLNLPTTTSFASPVAYYTPLAISPTRNVVVGDFNSDGIPDLAVTDLYSERLSLFMGNGDGTFQAPIASNNVPGGPLMATGDILRTGKTDIIVTGGGMFTYIPTCNCYAFAYTNGAVTAVATGDFNNDGRLDAVIGEAGMPVVGYLETAPNGAFYPEIDSASGGSGEVDSIAVGDFNRDGNLDVAVISGGQVSIMLGNGNGTFRAPVLYPVVGTTIAAADFNGDGKLDLVVGSSSSSTGWLLFGNGDGTFGSADPFNAGSSIDSQIAVADINNDGQPDVVFTNSALGTVTVLFGNGDGGFSPPAVFPAGVSPASVAVGDFNGDGIPDLVVTNTTSNQVSVLLGQQVASYSATGISLSGSGTHNVLTSYSGDGSRLPSQSSTVSLASGTLPTQTINFAPIASPVIFGVPPIALSATGGGTGNPIIFSVLSGPGYVSGNWLYVTGVGTIVVAADQAGNADYSAAPEVTQSVVVNKITPTFSVSCSPNPVVYGANTICTAVVGGSASGTASFYDNGSLWASPTISSGTASATGFAGQVPGTYSVTASYSGDSQNSPSSAGTTVTITQAPQSITFAPPASPVTYGVLPISLSASTSSGLGVSFSVLSGPATVSGSILTITGAGTVIVAANQPGNADYSAAPQVTTTIVVNKATPTLTWATPATITYGTPLSGVQLDATSGGVAGSFAYAPPPGTVLSAGTHTLSVAFTPSDSVDYNNQTASVSLTVNQATAGVSVSCSPNPITYGSQTTSCTTTVGGSATGTVAWTINGGAWTTTPVTSPTAGGFAGYGVGSYAIGVTYSGDSNYSGSISSTTLNIVQASTSLTVSCAPNPMSFGSTTSCTAHVSGGTGTVVFTGDSGTWPIAVDGGGNAVLTGFGNWPAGTYPINAAYSGDVNFTGSSNSTTLVINPASPTVTLACAPTSISLGSNTTCTATVPAPDGTVAFYSTADLTGKWWNAAFPAGGGDLAAAPVATTQDGSLNYNITGYPWAAATAAPAGVASTNVYARWTGTFVSPVAGMYTIGVNSDDGANVYVNGTAVVGNLATPQGATTDSTYSQSGQIILTAGTINSIVVEYQQGAGGAGIQLLWTPPGESNPSLLGWTVVPVNASSQASVTGGSAWNAGTYNVTGVYSGDANYAAATSNVVPVTVSQATPTVRATCSPSTMVFGSTTSCTAHVSAGTGTVSFSGGSSQPGPWTEPVDGSGNAVLTGFSNWAAGTYTVQATYSGDSNYNGATGSAVLTITTSTPVLTWATPAAITYGTPLSATQLDATSGGLAGTFSYTPAAGTVLAAGSQTLSVTFTPTDTVDYATQTATVTLVVNKAPLTVTPNPSSKVYGTANPVFTGSITGLVAGDTITATYASAATTTTVVGVYSSGVNAISATLSDPGNKLANYTLAQNVGTLTITQSTTVLTWSTPAAITYGTALSSTQLDATADGVAGVFVYSPLAGTVLSAGTHTLNVTFTPTDGADYSTATASVILMVNPAALTVTPAPSSKVYGTANPVFTGSIIGMIPGDGITATYSSAATTTTSVGVYSAGPDAIAATLSDPGSKLGNYTLNQTVGAFTITQATTVLTWATPAAITYETPLSVTQLDATSGGVIGTYVYTPAAGTILTGGTHTLSVAFTPSDAVDYSSASATVSLTVNKATPTVVLTSSGNPTVYGGSVTFTAQTATSATGTMTFYDGAAIIGTGTLSGGVATFTVNSLGAGTHSITASYPGDSNYLSAVSAAVSQIVTRAPVTITVTSSLNPSSFGQSVTFTFTVAGVSGLATPTGTIAFSDGSTLLASPTLNAFGVATYTTVMLSGGSHTLSAVYGGDANYQ